MKSQEECRALLVSMVENYVSGYAEGDRYGSWVGICGQVHFCHLVGIINEKEFKELEDQIDGVYFGK